MKRFLILLLSCMLLVPSFGSFFVYTTFKLNQEEISKTICVQRKMLFNDCNGRCELQKSLKKYEDNEKRMQNNLKEKTEIIYIQNFGITPFELLLPIETEAKLYASLNEKPVSISKTVFHPPSCIL